MKTQSNVNRKAFKQGAFLTFSILISTFLCLIPFKIQANITLNEVKQLFVSEQTGNVETLQTWKSNATITSNSRFEFFSFSKKFYEMNTPKDKHPQPSSGQPFGFVLLPGNVTPSNFQRGVWVTCGVNPARWQTLCIGDNTDRKKGFVKNSNLIKSITPSFTSNATLSFNQSSTFANVKARCDSSKLCDAKMTKDDNKKDVLVITIKKPLKKLNVTSNAPFGNKFYVNIVIPNDPSDPVYGMKIQNLNISGGTAAAGAFGTQRITVVVSKGPITFETVKIKDAKFATKDDVLMIVTQSITNTGWTTKEDPNIPISGASKGWWNGYGPGMYFGLKKGNSNQRGHFYIYGPESVFTLYSNGGCEDASLIADRIIMNQKHIQGNVIYGSYLSNGSVESHVKTPQCKQYDLPGGVVDVVEEVTEYDYNLSMTPNNDLLLICGTSSEKSSTFTMNSNRTTIVNGKVTTSERFKTSVKAEVTDASKFDIIATSGSGRYPNFETNNQGVLTLKITPKNNASPSVNKTYYLKVTTAENIQKTSSFKFTPFKFDFSEATNSSGFADVVAGATTPIPLNVLACDATSGNPTVVTDYNKKPTMTFTKPSGGTGTVTYTPSFNNGKSNSALRVDNSGAFTIKLTDNSFNCVGYSDCPIDGKVSLTGSLAILSRPWAFAVCDENGNEIVETANFGISGKPFSLQLKPLLWRSGYPSPSIYNVDVTGKNYCNNNNPITSNFFLPSQLAIVIIEGKSVVYPNGGILGSGIKGAVLNRSKTSNGKALLVSGLSWDNVGRLELEITSTGYSNKINKSIARTGMIYPYKLLPKSISWDYANGSNFSYMGQAFNYTFEVEAQSMGGKPTTNYGLFNATDKSSNIDLVAVKKNSIGENTGENLSGRIFKYATPATWGKNAATNGAILTESGTLLFNKKAVGSLPLKTKEDGPYDSTNSAFGLKVSTVKGDVNFKPLGTGIITIDGKIAERFISQPTIRYGRMKLGKDMLTGALGSEINIPLIVEYWDGDKFVTSSDDNTSSFRASSYCSDPSTSSIYFKNRDNSNAIKRMQNGKFNDLVITQSDKKAEKARIFLRQGSSTPNGATCASGSYTQSWLQYNWRNLGDEDPSTWVTFGPYRGSDRVILRQEI